MSHQIKAECGKMFKAGASISDINQVIPDIVMFWDTWREDTLRACMKDFDELEREAASVDGPSSPLTPPLRTN